MRGGFKIVNDLIQRIVFSFRGFCEGKLGGLEGSFG